MSERAGTERSSLGHMPDDRWEFDGEVTRVFDDMLERSIPQYQTMRHTVFEVGSRFLDPGAWVMDLGCSRGEALAPFVDAGYGAFGLEVSPPMLEAARKRYEHHDRVTIAEHDLRDPIHGPESTQLVLSVLTLMFTPINHRQRIVQESFDLIRPGGAMILVEKVLGRGARLDRMMVETYHDSKAAAGYSREEIDRKALALEGVQVPVTAAWNEALLKDAGFREVDCFWRWMNFAGWVAIK